MLFCDIMKNKTYRTARYDTMNGDKLKIFSFEGQDISPEKLPIPTGWHLLVGMIKLKKETSGGIVLLDESIEKEGYIRCLAKVLAVGSHAYQASKFQGGIDIRERQPESWIKVGDIVALGAYIGLPVTLTDDGEKHTVKLINDDEVLAIIPDINAILT